MAVGAVLLGAIALTAVAVGEGRGIHRGVPLLACIAIAATWIGPLTRWRSLLSALLLVILFIPMGRYSLPGNLPFHLEPYRVLVAGLALAWVLSMLVDRGVSFRRSV